MKLIVFLFILLVLVFQLNSDGLLPIGSGTENDPYQVANLENLLWFSSNANSWNNNFIQIENIDATDTKNWNNGEGFIPIGNPDSLIFSGSYNGQNYTIANLYINRPDSSCQAFLGYMENAIIQNVNFTNSEINGLSRVGSIVGICASSSIIDSCYSSGVVSGSNMIGGLVGFTVDESYVSNCFNACTVVGNIDIGGLSGILLNANIYNCYNLGEVNGFETIGGLIGKSISGSEIKNCYNGGFINGNQSIGGLIGINYSSSEIIKCFNEGNVEGIGANIGGLVGSNSIYSDINNCFNSGSISGNSNVGGLIGSNSSYSIISNCFNYGLVIGNSNTGGIVASNSASINNSFWDIETSGQLTSSGGTGKTTSEMKNIATYTELSTEGLSNPWDFVGNPCDDIENYDFWNIDEIMNNSYPYLTWQSLTHYTPEAPYNVIIAYSTFTITITWEYFSEAALFKVYSSSTPYGIFIEDATGIFFNKTWYSPIYDDKKFFYVTATN
ncbi:MAG: hypothetical protein K8S23_15230 [Candidatus Cloacimonetes bacterium]|nr:hypothetical protein [Candidatus Cloacimonadota bacterium]